MPWQEIRFQIQQHQLESVEARLESLAALSVTLEDAGDQPLLEPLPGSTPLWDSMTVIALFDMDIDPDRIQRELSPLIKLDNWQYSMIADQDWERSWMDQFEPIQTGDRLWICPSWKTPPNPEAVNLILDPGLAFGSGTHPTTRLCLQWLDAHPPTGQEIIDYGCGSGILGIAAILLGAQHVTAVDLDPQALKASRNNAENNRINARQLAVCHPDEVVLPMVDILLANILSGPLISLAPKLAKLAHDGGTIVLSGILEEQAASVTAAYRPWFNINTWACKAGWVCLTGEKQSGP